MKKKGNSLLTVNEFICMNIACIMGISVLYIANSAVEKSKQDGWIAALLGGIYPLYIVLLGIIIIKNYPNISIMELSKQFLGKVFGNALNFIFMAQFLYYVIGVMAAANNLLKTYSSWFIDPIKITLTITLLTIYGVSKGIKTLARINVITFFIICAILASAAIAFSQGSIDNIRPVFGSGIKSIADGTMTTVFSYALMEGIFIIHPYVENKEKILRAGLLSTAAVIFFYTWSVLTSIVYLGSDIVPKSLWPFAFVSESVKVPVVNNYRFIWIILWPIIIFRTMATEYYMSVEVMNHIWDIGIKKWCVIFFPIIFIFPLFFKNEVSRRSFYGDTTRWITIFNLFYITVIAIMVVIKKNLKAEK